MTTHPIIQLSEGNFAPAVSVMVESDEITLLFRADKLVAMQAVEPDEARILATALRNAADELEKLRAEAEVTS